jgi:hypothetical protein
MKMMIEATATNFIKIDSFQQIEGEYIATASCFSFDEYKAFPNVIDIQGRIMVKTGWNSDTNYVCFKSNCLIGYPVS